MRALMLLACAVYLLAACGTRGALVLPPPPSLVDHSSKAVEAAP
ncbi:MAG TPA: hypothetical protein VMC81_11955 [Rhodocyclaceae bacterium]|nr:hypothetical protein [Rhodocyclaceae bacterium]